MTVHKNKETLNASKALQYLHFMLSGYSILHGDGRARSLQINFHIPQRHSTLPYGCEHILFLSTTAPLHFSPDMPGHVDGHSVDRPKSQG